MERIRESEIKYSKYNIDPFGRVFFWNKFIFRGIDRKYVKLCQDIFDSGLVKELIEKKLIVNTKIADYKSDNYDLILEHDKIVATHPSEWTFSMIKDAIISLLEINEICNRYGFQLKDGHLWNIAFSKNHPIFIDFGSFNYYSDELKKAFKEEVSVTVIVLILWSLSEEFLAQKIIENCVSFYKRTLPVSSIWDSKIVLRLLREYFNFNESEEDLKDFILNQISIIFIKDKIILSDTVSTVWNNYQDDLFKKDNIDVSRFNRFEKIFNLIQMYSPEVVSVLDLAGNMGGILNYIEQKTSRFSSLINVDYDESAIEKSYKILKELNSSIETYVLNFMLPTRDEVRSVLKSDVVLALAVTHHLVLTQNYNLDFIFESIKSYSNKYVYIEFMPLGLYGGDDNNIPPVPNWYHEKWFRDCFLKKFDLLHEEKLEKNRIIFVGIIKE
jgi:hypothetical protein